MSPLCSPMVMGNPVDGAHRPRFFPPAQGTSPNLPFGMTTSAQSGFVPANFQQSQPGPLQQPPPSNFPHNQHYSHQMDGAAFTMSHVSRMQPANLRPPVSGPTMVLNDHHAPMPGPGVHPPIGSQTSGGPMAMGADCSMSPFDGAIAGPVSLAMGGPNSSISGPQHPGAMYGLNSNQMPTSAVEGISAPPSTPQMGGAVPGNYSMNSDVNGHQSMGPKGCMKFPSGSMGTINFNMRSLNGPQGGPNVTIGSPNPQFGGMMPNAHLPGSVGQNYNHIGQNGKVYPPDQPMIFNPANPHAPPIYPCGICHKEVHDTDEAILCESGCNFWFHRICTGLHPHAYTLLTSEVYAEWVCDKCLKSKPIPLVKFKA